MKQVVLHKDETLEQILLNEQNLDLHILQEAGSTLRLHLFHWKNFSSENHILVEQRGENCTTEINGLIIGSGNQHISNITHVVHAVGKGTSRQLFKYILGDQAEGYFEGRLKIVQDAQQTSAEQTNRNLLLSTTARMRTLPQLEIYADDVKASHGASTGQLDESALFYMQQRGLTRSQARMMLINAFAQDVLNAVSDDTLRQQIALDIEQQIEKIMQSE